MNITLDGTKITQDTRDLAFEKNSGVDEIVITVDTDESWSYKLDVKYPNKYNVENDRLYNIIDLDRNGNICSVTLTREMLPFNGKYTMQLRGINGDKVYHSDIFETWVKYSIEPGSTYDPVPSEFYQIEKNLDIKVNEAKQYVEVAEKAAVDAKVYADRAATLAADVSEKAAQTAQNVSDAANAMEAAQTAQRGAETAKAEAKTSADNSAVSAAAAADSATEAAQTLASIPEDYSALNQSVSELKSDIAEKINKPTSDDNNKFPRAKDGNVEWVEQGLPTDEQTANAVQNWLNEHPEATTTVQDASITEDKFTDVLRKKKANYYISVEKMKEDTALIVDTVCVTLGYYEPNDGGGATYRVREKKTSDVDDGGSIHILANDFVAEMIIEEDTVDVRQYGAKGDGVTNDKIAIQNALNNHRCVIMYSGVYRANELYMKSNSRLVGIGMPKILVPDDVVITSYTSFDKDPSCLWVLEEENVIIDGIDLNANYAYLAERTGYDCNARFSSFGVRVLRSKNVVVKNCRMNNLKDSAVQITEAYNVTIDNNIMFDEGFCNAFTRGVQCIYRTVKDNADYTIRNNKIFNTGEHGITVYRGNSRCLIEGNFIKYAGCLYTNPDGSSDYCYGEGIKSAGNSDMTVVNNRIEGSFHWGIGLEGECNNCIVSNNVVDGNLPDVDYSKVLEDHGSGGINIEDGKNNVISNNIVCNRKRLGPYLHACGISGAIKNTDVIVGNRIFNCYRGINHGGVVTGNYLDGIDSIGIIASSDSVISDNVINNTSEDAILCDGVANVVISANKISNVPTNKRGVIFKTSADNINIFGNIFNNVNSKYLYYFYNFTPTNTKIDFVEYSG